MYVILLAWVNIPTLGSCRHRDGCLARVEVPSTAIGRFNFGDLAIIYLNLCKSLDGQIAHLQHEKLRELHLHIVEVAVSSEPDP